MWWEDGTPTSRNRLTFYFIWLTLRLIPLVCQRSFWMVRWPLLVNSNSMKKITRYYSEPSLVACVWYDMVWIFEVNFTKPPNHFLDCHINTRKCFLDNSSWQQEQRSYSRRQKILQEIWCCLCCCCCLIYSGEIFYIFFHK